MNIRRAKSVDAEELHNLYFKHLTPHPPKEAQDMPVWRDMITRFENDPRYYLLVGEVDGRIVSSVTLVLIENLTHNLCPYAIIENVVTLKGFRGKHYATGLMERACEIAKDHSCYKMMLLTGSKEDSTLHFYKNCGFNCDDKTAFIKWL